MLHEQIQVSRSMHKVQQLETNDLVECRFQRMIVADVWIRLVRLGVDQPTSMPTQDNND